MPGEPGYLSKSHVWHVLDAGCDGLRARFPRAVAEQLVDFCETYVEEYASDVARLLIEFTDGHLVYNMCAKGEDGAEACSSGLSRRAWEEDVVRSPFSMEPTAEDLEMDDDDDDAGEDDEEAVLAREEAAYKAEAFEAVTRAVEEADWAAEQEAAWAGSAEL